MRRIAIVAAVIVAVAAAGGALATPGGGITDVVSFVQGRTTERVHANADGVKLKTKGRVDVFFQTGTFQPGGTSGWHSHSGIVIIAVKSGELTRYDKKCRAVSFGAGESFVEHGGQPVLVRNEGTEPAVIYSAYVLPDATLRRIDEPNPGCPVQ
ncbi:MAG TPA: cupin domain-containing protein [Gaiellaceae bacterium]|nr:cupin domain-containing protein [Gaiellaceae bacterium]